MKKFLKNKKGFTLVELLVVLAIIGILVGLAIAGIRLVQQVNRDTQRKAFTRDVSLVLEAYQEQHNSYPGTVTAVLAGSPCAANEVLLTAGEQTLCSRINFGTVPPVADCSGFGAGSGSSNSGDLELCYEGQTKGYLMKVRVERSDNPYDASNVEPT